MAECFSSVVCKVSSCVWKVTTKVSCYNCDWLVCLLVNSSQTLVKHGSKGRKGHYKVQFLTTLKICLYNCGCRLEVYMNGIGKWTDKNGHTHKMKQNHFRYIPDIPCNTNWTCISL